MKEKILTFFAQEDFEKPADPDHIDVTEQLLCMTFPAQYKEFMLNSNGIEGAIGENAYVAIWRIEEIFDRNKDYDVDEYTPGLVYFGSDGSDMAFAFDKRSEKIPIVTIPFESIHIEDAKKIGDTFIEFLKYLQDF